MGKKNNFLVTLLFLIILACTNLEEISFISVTTTQVSTIRTTSFTIEGEISGLIAEDRVKEHGFVYSLSNREPDLADDKILNGSINTNRIFTNSITGLAINATYYVRAFVQKEGETPIFGEVITVSLNEIEINFSKITIEKGVGKVILRNTINGLEVIEKIDNYGHVWSNVSQLPTFENGNANSLNQLQANSVDVESIVSVDQLAPLDTYYVRSFIVSGNIPVYSKEVAKFVKGDIWRQRSDNFNNIFSAFVQFTFEIDGEIYVFKNQNSFGKYNFQTDEWTELAPINENIFSPVTFTIGRKGYVGTGQIEENGSRFYVNYFWEFDPDYGTKGQWIKQNLPEKMPFRRDAISFSINQKGYIGLGNNDSGELRDLWEYTPSTNTWQKAPNSDNLMAGRIRHMNYFSFKNMGCIKEEFPLVNCYCYRTSTGWQAANNFPFNISGSGNHRFFTINNSGFIIIADDTDNFWEFDAAFISADGKVGQWIPRIDFPGDFEGRGNPFSVDGKGYIGINEGNKESLWEYTPAINSGDNE